MMGWRHRLGEASGLNGDLSVTVPVAPSAGDSAVVPYVPPRGAARSDGERGSRQPATSREPWDGPNMEGS